MRTTQIVAGIVLAVFLLGIAVLEVVSERVRVEPPVPEAAPSYVAESEIREQPGVEIQAEAVVETQKFVVLQDDPVEDRRR